MKIGTGTATEALDAEGDILASDSITASSAILKIVDIISGLTSLQTQVNGKQDVLTFDDDLVLNSIVVKPGFLKANYTAAADGEIRCDILTVADVDISTLIASKQNILTQGNNITIDENNVISSSGGGSITQSELDFKQNILNNITQNNIKAHRLDLSNLHMDPGIFYYNGVSIDDMIGAKQTKFT